VDHKPGSKRGISANIRRLLDQRGEKRNEAESQTAILTHLGNRHDVALINLSSAGAMIVFDGDLTEGDEVGIQLLDHGLVSGHVRWIRDGRVGVSFAGPADPVQDDE